VRNGLAISILFFSSIGWGLTWLPVKGINQMGLDGIHLVFIAFASAGILLSPFIFLQHKSWRGNIQFLLLIAFIGGLANLLFQTALVHGDVVRVMILFYLLPVWSVLGGWYVLKEKPDLIRIGAVVISLVGALLILNVDSQTFDGLSGIDIVAIGAGMAFAFNNILFRKTAEQPIASKVSAMFIGCAILIGGFLVFNTPTTALPTDNAPLYAALYGVLFLTLITFGTQWGVTQLEAGKAALIIVMELVAAVVSVALLTDLVLSAREIAGGLLVISAAMIEGWREPTAEATEVIKS
jgi:drug/metabolite transporter (DMT)-like permease